MIKNSIALLLTLGALSSPALAQPPDADQPPAEPPSERDAPPDGEEVAAAVPPAEAGARAEDLYTPGGLTSDEAAARAIETAPTLDAARAQVRAAEARADQAFYNLFPRLDLSARYTRLSRVDQPSFGADVDPTELEGALAGVDDPEARVLFENLFGSFGDFSFPVILDQYALRAGATYPVSAVLASVLPSYRASRTFADAQRLQVEAQQRTVGLQARDAFYNYARVRGQLLVAETTVRQIEANRANIAALVQAGVAAPVDLMRIDAQLATARVGVERATAGVAIAAQALRTLMHVEGDDPMIPIGENLAEPPPPAEAGGRDAWIARALDQRAELRALRLAATGQEHVVSANAGRRWPVLAVQANYDFANPNNRIIPQQEEFRGTWDVSVVLSWSPNDYLDANTTVEQARADLAQARADIASLSDAVRIEVTQAYENLQAARAALEAARVGIAAAEETYRVRNEELRAGTAVTRDLIDAEADLARARLEGLNALIDVYLARAELARAVGE